MAEDLDQVFRAPKATDPIRDRLGLDRVGSARTTSSAGSRGSSVGAVSPLRASEEDCARGRD